MQAPKKHALQLVGIFNTTEYGDV
jgi:CRP-like cAMP-binding protein